MTKIILLGTGTPNPDPFRAGPCIAILVDKNIYLIDFGTGLVRRWNKISKIIKNFDIRNFKTAFLTHLHSDHTLGFADLIFTPWILGRTEPLSIYGPKGLSNMANHITKAYEIDINQRVNGFEKANTTGYKVLVNEISSGIIYTDNLITVEAFPVIHGNFEAYGYKFTTKDKVIVISGDTSPSKKLIEIAKNCDVLIHEAYYANGLKTRSEKWQKYHSSVHTSGIELGHIASEVKPKKLVLYHQLFMQENILLDDMAKNDKFFKEKIINEIKENFNGKIHYGNDLDII